MNRYHYIDDQGNISDALPLEALRKINLAPTTKVLVEGGKQWVTLGEASQGGPVVFPPPPIPAAAAAPPPPVPSPPAFQSSVVTPPKTDAPPVQCRSAFYLTFFLGVFLGVFGAHRFYVRKIGTGLLQLVTFGGLGIWWLVDMILILLGRFRDKSGAAIPNIAPKLSWSVFAVVIIIVLASGGSDSGSSASKSGSSSSTSSGWGSTLERELVGIYECARPMWVVQLKSGGDYAMEALESGNRFRGTWAASGDGGILKPDVGASLTFTIYSDGALKIDKYDYTFVRTR